MKRNMFGDMKVQPEDDLANLWDEEFGVDLLAEEIEVLDIAEDPNFGWGCTLRDSEENEAELQDFPSRETVIEYLTNAGLDVE